MVRDALSVVVGVVSVSCISPINDDATVVAIVIASLALFGRLRLIGTRGTCDKRGNCCVEW